MPEKAIIIGNQSYTEQPIERGFDPRRGPTTTRRFKGVKADILNIKSVFDGAGWTTRFTEGPVCSLEATIGQDTDGTNPPVDTPIDTWELSANVTEKDILQTDSEVVLAAIDYNLDYKKLRDLIKGTSKFEDFDDTDFVTDEAWTLAKLIASGVQSRIIYQPVLRHNQSVSNVYSVPASLTNVGSILLSTTLLAQEAIPSSIANNLPSSGGAITKDGLTRRYGWYKTHPTIQSSAFNKTTISQEWQWGLWSTDLYTVL